MPSPSAELPLYALAGLALGAAYFAGLWYTVRQVARRRWSGLALAASLSVRLGLLCAALVLLAGGRWERMAAMLAGLLAARLWWVRRIERNEASEP